MTNRTRALGFRILSALKNDRVIVVSNTSLHSVTLTDDKGVQFAAVASYELWDDAVSCDEGYALFIRGRKDYVYCRTFNALVTELRAIMPSPKVRKSYIKGVTRHPQFIGVKIG